MEPGIVNSAAYANGRRIGEVHFPDIREWLQQPDVFIWIGLYEPDEGLLKQLQQEFGLHDLAIEDAHRAHQRPKIERYGDCLFVVMRTVQLEDEAHHVRFGETHVFVGARYLISVRHGPSQSYAEVRARVEASPFLLQQGPGFALYALMDFIVDQYFPVVYALEEDLEALEEKLFGETYSRDTTAHIYYLQRELLQVKRAISPVVEMCNQLTRFDHAIVAETTRVYFRDVYDHALRMTEMVDTLRELLTTTLEANFSLISINQNEVMKRLAAWAAIIAVPTMVAGIYGMNFQFMPELNWPFGYPLVVFSTWLLCVIVYRAFKRAGWL